MPINSPNQNLNNTYKSITHKSPTLIIGIRFLQTFFQILNLIRDYPNHYDFKLIIQWVVQNLKGKLGTSTI